MEGQLGMACNGGSIIASVLEHLKLEDVQLLLENRGMPSIGDKEQLTERLQVQIRPSACVVPLLVIHSRKKIWKHCRLCRDSHLKLACFAGCSQ